VIGSLFFYSPLNDVETTGVRTTIAAKAIASTDCEKQDGRPSSPSPGIELRTAFELSHRIRAASHIPAWWVTSSYPPVRELRVFAS
jgi:hypothetical protein